MLVLALTAVKDAYDDYVREIQISINIVGMRIRWKK